MGSAFHLCSNYSARVTCYRLRAKHILLPEWLQIFQRNMNNLREKEVASVPSGLKTDKSNTVSGHRRFGRREAARWGRQGEPTIFEGPQKGIRKDTTVTREMRPWPQKGAADISISIRTSGTQGELTLLKGLPQWQHFLSANTSQTQYAYFYAVLFG